MASYLGHFKGCASYRQQKFIRAVDSCINQTDSDFELIIVSDGCNDTMRIYQELYKHFPYIKCVQINKQKVWSGVVRNIGIKYATGEYITYLDTDDVLGRNHIKILNENAHTDWYWYDDYRMNAKYFPVENHCQLIYGQCGTSNVTHRKSLGVVWNDSTYQHDWKFIQELMKHENYRKIQPCEYYICHLPELTDL